MHVLYVTTIGGTMRFFRSFIYKLLSEGHVVDIAANMVQSQVPACYKDWGCKLFQISCSRLPLDKGNINAIREIETLVSENHYDIVHCHTPIAAFCTRIACRKVRKKGTKVIYTAHGFHFYQGAPFKNWLLFYLAEKICSYFTDVLITINTEDYEFAKRKFSTKSIQYVPGVGIDVEKFANTKINAIKKRQEIGVPEDAFMMLSVGELNINKNHQVVIKALAQLNDKKVHYVIAGSGNQYSNLINLAREHGIDGQVHLLGHRNDVAELYKAADIYLLPSIREGLNVSVMEAMSSGLPCIISDIRGNRDLVDDGKGGFLVSPFVYKNFSDKIRILIKDSSGYGMYNFNKAKEYEIVKINNEMAKIYNS